ncbi:MAG: NAD(+) kinase [Gammaproteobacteria bacterium]|nr:NAD(+) kinase [Gammaproteobacteria bacterium]
MNSSFQRIGLISKYGATTVGATLRRLIEYLQARGREIILDSSAAEHVPDTRLSCVERQALAARCDLVIVVGGDGTILNAGRSLADAGVPLVGVNLGRLGFLADVSPDLMTDQLDQILTGEYAQEERALLHATVQRDGETLSTSDALNDVVIHKWDVARMIELEVRIDERLLNTQRSDGLIVATPTGSTAYALSGGGPILHPSLDAMVLVPICPHSLNNRPIVINETSTVEITVHAGDYTQAQLSCDGQVNVALLPGDRVSIRKKTHALKLIHPPGYDYYEILRRKFGWGKTS